MRRKFGSISKNCMAAIMSASIMMSSVVAFPMTAMAGDYYLENGSITVHATTGGQTVTQGSNETSDNTPVIHNDDPSNNVQCDQTTNTITIEAESGTTANVTLQDVNIDTGNNGGAAVTVTGRGAANIELDGSNTVKSGNGHAGIEDNLSGTLTIQDTDSDGTLTANGGSYGAGIGNSERTGNAKDIIISGGNVTATGGEGAAGIGGGQVRTGNYITISGGNVTAIGGEGAAGIGGGSHGSGSNITINGGTVIATGGQNGAGIGGGTERYGSEITISEAAQVSAAGGGASGLKGSGAAIGNGGLSDGENHPVDGTLREGGLDTSGLYTTGRITKYEPGISAGEIANGAPPMEDPIVGTVPPPVVRTPGSPVFAVNGFSSAASSVGSPATTAIVDSYESFQLKISMRLTQTLDFIALRPDMLQALQADGLTLDTGNWVSFKKETYALIDMLTQMGITVYIRFVDKGQQYQVTIPKMTTVPTVSLCNEEGYCGFMNLANWFDLQLKG